MADEKVKSDEFADTDREQRSKDSPRNGEQEDYCKISSLKPVFLAAFEIEGPGRGDESQAEKDREELVGGKNSMLVELGPSLSNEHGRERKRQYCQAYSKEIAGPDRGMQFIRERLMIQPVGPSQGSHGHAETLYAHRDADNLQRLQIKLAELPERVENGNEDNPTPGTRGIGNDCPDHPDAGQKPERGQKLGIVAHAQPQRSISEEKDAPANQD